MRKLRLVITAGPTREMIDPVRFLSNVSTGEMGYALARAAKAKGHSVALISGPTALRPPKGVRFVPIVSGQDLKRAIMDFWADADILIMTAAVCDYTPRHYSRSKIKRIKCKAIQFKRTEDILKYFGARKGKRIMVGFSLETDRIEENARKKLVTKNLNLIVANWLSRSNHPFGNVIFSMKILDPKGTRVAAKGVSKKQAAGLILKEVIDFFE